MDESIAGLRANAVVEVVADQIDHGGLRDRLAEDAGEHRALVESIRTYGQQVPVLIRHSPNVEGRYEAIDGRRRIAALKELGWPVRAMIRDLPDREQIVVQGQENAARRHLTFIETVNLARQMREAGFVRPVICDALRIDKTAISRMLALADAVPPLIEAIGPAPGVGRDRWRALGDRLAARAPDAATLKVWARDLGRVEGSDARFDAALAAAAEARPPAPPSPPRSGGAPARPRPLAGADGAPLGTGPSGARRHDDPDHGPRRVRRLARGQHGRDSPTLPGGARRIRGKAHHATGERREGQKRRSFHRRAPHRPRSRSCGRSGRRGGSVPRPSGAIACDAAPRRRLRLAGHRRERPAPLEGPRPGRDEGILAPLAREAGAGPDRIIGLVLDDAGRHGAPGLAAPDGLRLVHRPAHTPEPRPAETLGAQLDAAVARQCVALGADRDRVRGQAGFHRRPARTSRNRSDGGRMSGRSTSLLRPAAGG